MIESLLSCSRAPAVRVTGRMGSASTAGLVAAAVAPAVPEVVVAARAVWVSAVVSAEPEELADQVNKGQERRAYRAHSSTC